MEHSLYQMVVFLDLFYLPQYLTLLNQLFLGMHKIQDRPMVVNGNIEIRPVMYLALTYDHRLLDGKDAVSFLVKIKEILESPESMILGV